jgi:Raf kinase inhibitor-like YbhB/YbcL family protein
MVPKVLTVTSPDFSSGGKIPKRHAKEPEGENVAPKIRWTGVPDDAKEIVLICDDPDAPTSEPWVHWVVFRIPGNATEIDRADGILEGKNSWKELGWGGPLPPPGSGAHRYRFTVYATDKPVTLNAGASKHEVLAAIRGHVRAEGMLQGTYER